MTTGDSADLDDGGSAVGAERKSGPIFNNLGGRAAWVLVILLLINVVNFVDRQLPFILLESIKRDLHLTDTEIGLMAGLSFAVIYSLAALPFAFLADRWSSRFTLAIAVSVWSLLTAMSGLATSFTGLLLSRMGVAASEAGSNPCAHALISRAFPAQRRAYVLGLFSLGVPLGSMIGLVAGGWINQFADWRTAFFLVGSPGLVLAVCAAVFLPTTHAAPPGDGPGRGFWSGAGYLLSLRSFRHMSAGSALYACGSYGMNVFAASFLIRVHHLTSSQAGLGFGLAFGFGGLAGTFFGGVLADALGKRHPRWLQLVPAIGQLLSFPTVLGAWLAPNAFVSIGLLALSYVFGLLYFAPSFAVAQSLAPDRLRATAAALLGLCLTLVGASVGPMTIGWVSDRLTPQFGALSLRYAMCTMGVTILWSAWHFYRASRALAADLQRTTAA